MVSGYLDEVRNSVPVTKLWKDLTLLLASSSFHFLFPYSSSLFILTFISFFTLFFFLSPFYLSSRGLLHLFTSTLGKGKRISLKFKAQGTQDVTQIVRAMWKPIDFWIMFSVKSCMFNILLIGECVNFGNLWFLFVNILVYSGIPYRPPTS